MSCLLTHKNKTTTKKEKLLKPKDKQQVLIYLQHFAAVVAVVVCYIFYILLCYLSFIFLLQK